MKTTLALALLLGAVLCVDYYPQQQHQQHQQYNYPPQQQQQGYYPQPVYGQQVYPKFVKEDPKPDKPLDGEFIEGTLKAGGGSGCPEGFYAATIENIQEEEQGFNLASITTTGYESYCIKITKYEWAAATWEQVNDDCEQAGGRLASVHTPEQNDFLKALRAEHDANAHLPIGLIDQDNSVSGMYWTDGSGFDNFGTILYKHPWNNSNPDDKWGLEKGVSIWKTDDWVDIRVKKHHRDKPALGVCMTPPPVDAADGIAVTKYYVFITGVFTNEMVIGGKKVTNIYPDIRNQDIFVACFRRYDATLKWVKVAGGPNRDYGIKIAVNEAASRVYVVGSSQVSPTDSRPIVFARAPWEVILNTKGGRRACPTPDPVDPARRRPDEEPYDPELECDGSPYDVAFLACYKAKDGKLVWAQPIISSQSDTRTHDVAVETVAGKDYIYVSWSFKYDATFHGLHSQIKLENEDPGTTTFYTNDFFVAKYDGEGWVKWARSGGGTLGDEALSIALDDHVVYTTGYFNGFNNDAYIARRENDAIEHQALTEAPAHEEDIFLAMFSKYDGEFLGARVAGGPGFDAGFGVTVDCCDKPNKKVYVTGAIGGAAYFGNEEHGESAARAQTLVAKGASDLFVAAWMVKGGAFRWAVRVGSNDPDHLCGNADANELNHYPSLILRSDEIGNYTEQSYACVLKERGISIDVAEGGLIIVGQIGKVPDIDFNNERDIITPGDGDFDWIVMKLDCWNGDLIWYNVGESLDGLSRFSSAKDVAIDHGYIFFTGYYFGETSFDALGKRERVTEIEGIDIFVSVISLCGEECKCEAPEECVNCYKHAPQYYYQQSYAPYQYHGQPYYYSPQQHQQYVY